MAHELEFDESGKLVIRFSLATIIKMALVLALSVGAWITPLEGLTPASRICFVIFTMAATLWVTEAIPPFATAITVIVLCVYLLGQPDGPLHLSSTGPDSYQLFLAPLAHPVLVLFFAGFIMQVAAAKHGFDIAMAKRLMKPFGSKPRNVILGIIGITALFSMFMSNTATTAMMIAVATPVLASQGDRPGFRKALTLAIPFAANLGGIGTIIGTPPNAVAASLLAEKGYPVTFLNWMLIGVPFVVVMLFVLWILLLICFKPGPKPLELKFQDIGPMTWDLLVVIIGFSLTVGLWITGPLHGIPSPVVALIPVLLFTTTSIIGREDLKRIEWDVLVLVAGGMTLGVAMARSGLSDVFVSLIPTGLPPMLLLGVMAAATLLISNFMSNTAAANLILPIVVSLAILEPRTGAIAVAFAASMAMSLPISTPPNAIAFSTRMVETRDLAVYGTMVSFIGLGVLALGIILI
jgi:sodium-dependent dicarboxylate transporter 2/3/5